MSLRRTLLTAHAATAAGVSGVSLIAPGLPELATWYGVGVDTVAQLQMAVMLPGVLAGVFMSLIAPRLSPRVFLGSSSVLFGVSGFMLVFVTDFALAVVLRLCQGWGSGVLVSSGFALLRRLDEPARTRATGNNSALITAMMVVLPLTGAALGVIAPTAPFAAYVLALGVALLARGGTDHVPLGRTRTSARTRTVGPGLVVVLGSTVLLNTVFFGWLLYLTPILLAQSFTLSVELRGMVLAAQSLVATCVTLAFARLCPRGRERGTTLMGWALVGSVFVTLAVTTDPLLGLLLLIAAGGFHGATNPVMVGIVGAMGDERLLGWWHSATRLGQILGPGIAALAYTSEHAPTALLYGASLSACGLLCAVFLPRPDRYEVG